MRMTGFSKTPFSIISRSGAGVSKRTLIIWLPGSPKAVVESLTCVIPAIKHVCDFLRGQAPH